MARKQYKYEDSAVWKLIGIGGNAILLNLTFLVCCIPLITIGPAFGGLFSAIRFYIRGDSWIDGFKEGFKNNIGRVMIIWSVLLAAIVFVGNDVILAVKTVNEPGGILSLVIPSLILLLIFMFATIFLTYNVYFPNYTKELLTETASFVFSHILRSLAATVLMWAPLFLLFATLSGIVFEFALVFLALYFSFAALFATMVLKPPYLAIFLERKKEEEKQED